MYKLLGTIFFLLATILFPFEEYHSDDVVIEALLDNNQVEIGDIVTLTVSVRCPISYEVIIPSLEQNWGAFEVLKQEIEMSVHEGEKQINTLIFFASYSLPGTYKTLPIEVLIIDSDGNSYSEVIASQLILVKSVIGENEHALRDIQDQFDFTKPAIQYWLFGILGLILLLFLWGYRNNIVRKNIAVEEENLSISEIVHRELLRIEQLSLLEKGQYTSYLVLVSDCLKDYLHAEFGIQNSLTTYELISQLDQHLVLKKHSATIVEILEMGDRAKFSEFIYKNHFGENYLAMVRKIVDETNQKL